MEKMCSECAGSFPLSNPYIDPGPLDCSFLHEHHPLGGGPQHWGLITLGFVSPRFSSKKHPYHLKCASLCFIIFPSIINTFHHTSTHFITSTPHPPSPINIPHPPSPIPHPHLYGSRLGGSRSHRPQRAGRPPRRSTAPGSPAAPEAPGAGLGHS